jgi:hypothetical protein
MGSGVASVYGLERLVIAVARAGAADRAAVCYHLTAKIDASIRTDHFRPLEPGHVFGPDIDPHPLV